MSPLLAGRIVDLSLHGFFINYTCERVLVNSLTSPHSCLRELTMTRSTFSSGVFNHLLAVIATSKLTRFGIGCDLDIDRAKAIATLLVRSKTLEEVDVNKRPTIDNDVAVILAEAMNHSSVKNLTIARLSKGTVLGSHYPTDRVNLLCF